jgi:hypothetical protein
MKEWVEFSKCVGKTVAKVHMAFGGRWLVLFTDDTWSSIATEYCNYAEDHELISKRPEATQVYSSLKYLGVIDQAESERLIKEAQAKADEEQLAFERAQYERLHAKFGKGEV